MADVNNNSDTYFDVLRVEVNNELKFVEILDPDVSIDSFINNGLFILALAI